jgi:CubicO group peptidase (beta-lactamase class C family)
MLVEEGRLRLGDAVDEWLPELANRRVLRTLASPLDDTVPARRPITVRDVLTYTMGFGSVMAPPGTHPIQKAIREQAIGGDGPKLPGQQPGPDEWLRRLGALPLIAQPGERWLYDVSGDVLGVLVARVSGRSFGAFLEERLFGPLGMADTAFHVPPDKIPRLPTFYRFDRKAKALAVFDGVTDSAWRTPPAFESGGGGLASTIDDYCTFLRMLLDEGRHGRGALLSRATVELMTSDQLTPDQRGGAELFFGSFSSWGLGVAVDIRREEIFHWPGRFGWTGGFGTMAYADPANALVGILFTQRLLDSPEPPRLFTDFWNLAYAAMD